MKLFNLGRGNDKNLEIIETAIRLFKSNGIANISMDEIARIIKISKKTLYVNFNSKEELVEKTIDHLFEKHFNFIESSEVKDLEVHEKILKIYKYGISEMIQFKPVFYQDLIKYYSSAHYKYENYRKKFIFEKIKGILEEAQLKGHIDSSKNINLFCELNLVELNKILSQSYMAKNFPPEILAEHSIGLSLKGLLKQ